MTVVAKMQCNCIESQDFGQKTAEGKSVTYKKVRLGAIYGTEGENKDFATATPSGEC